MCALMLQDFSHQSWWSWVCQSDDDCAILFHLRLRWRLGGENFTKNCVIWSVTQPLELCFILYLL